jgi:uncharacterized protein (DUF362 family)/ferredoxin
MREAGGAGGAGAGGAGAGGAGAGGAGAGGAPVVWLRAGLTYDAAAVRAALEFICDRAGLDDMVRARTAFCKVNAGTGGQPALARATHPVVVGELVGYLYRAGAKRVYVGESSVTSACTRSALASSGIAAAASAAGGIVVDIDGLRPRRLPLDLPRPVFTGDAVVAEDSVLISVAKLKTHSLAGYTGALKNMMGVVMGAGKTRLHQAGGAAGLHRLLAEVVRAVRPAFGIVDGITGMEGNGPSAGSPRRVGVLAGAADLVAVDAVICRHVGIAGDRVPLLRCAEALGLGTRDPRRIRVAGDAVAPLAPPFLPPGTATRLPDLDLVMRLQYLMRERAVSPSLCAAACDGCGECVAACPSGAIRGAAAAGGRPRLRRAACLRCFHCVRACPRAAIRFRLDRWLGPALLRRVRALGLDVQEGG